MATHFQLLMVGGGRMGMALMGGLIAAGRDPSTLAVAEVSAARRDELSAEFAGLTVVEAPVRAAGAVLAVKPGDVVEAAAAVGTAGVDRVLSVAGGITTAAIEAALDGSVPVVRAMPNTPALV